MPCPVLGVDRIVNDGGIEPEPVTLFAVVESCFECRATAASATATAATAATSGAIGSVFVRCLGGLRFALCERSFQISCDQRVVFCSKVKFFFDSRRSGRVIGRSSTIGIELLLALEGRDVICGRLKLMRDPSVGATLSHPHADLVQVWSERSCCHANEAISAAFAHFS